MSHTCSFEIAQDTWNTPSKAFSNAFVICKAMLDIPLVDDMELRLSGCKYCAYFNIGLSNGKLSSW